jgi:hypothetical protein
MNFWVEYRVNFSLEVMAMKKIGYVLLGRKQQK